MHGLSRTVAPAGGTDVAGNHSDKVAAVKKGACRAPRWLPGAEGWPRSHEGAAAGKVAAAVETTVALALLRWAGSKWVQRVRLSMHKLVTLL